MLERLFLILQFGIAFLIFPALPIIAWILAYSKDKRLRTLSGIIILPYILIIVAMFLYWLITGDIILMGGE